MAGGGSAEQEAAKEQRGFEVSSEDWAGTGVAGVFGALDLVDAIDLEAAVAAGAETLKDLGSDAPLPVRRAWALGDLARASQQPLTPPPSSAGPSAGAAFGIAAGGE